MKQGSPAETRPARAVVLRALREVYEGPAWHGPAIRPTLRGIKPRQAAWRPAPGRNTIRELVHHITLGRLIMLGRLTGERPGFPFPKRNTWWARTPGTFTPDDWRADMELLEQCQQRLLAAIRRAPAARFNRRRGSHTLAHELLHLAVHDAYHGGQISLLAKLAR